MFLLKNKLRSRRALKRLRGFTLVEVLVVLAIIGLIMGLAGPRVISYLNDSKVKAAKLQLENISNALDIFYIDNGRYPSSGEGLSALMQRPGDTANWNGPYLKGAQIPNDPWGRGYVYRSPGSGSPYDLYSQGPDGKENGKGQVQKSGAGSSSAGR